MTGNMRGSPDSRRLSAILAGDIERVFEAKGGKLLESYELFDIYEGVQIKAGYKSMAYSLTFRAKDRNLEETDLAAAMNKILKALEGHKILCQEKMQKGDILDETYSNKQKNDAISCCVVPDIGMCIRIPGTGRCGSHDSAYWIETDGCKRYAD